MAVGLVLLYHAGIPFVPGGFIGVDVFFVISGFLITTQLISEVDRTGTVSIVRFYARRAKRLLPAAAIVLAATALLTWVFIPATRWREIGGDTVASALYVVNWRLADRSVDYLAEDSQPSPLQHFWSLAVEEQYYVVWPVLMLLAVLVARVARRRASTVLAIGLALVIVPSFAWSLAQTASVPARAYFETTTRMWELGIGAALALAAGALPRLPKTWAATIGWAGLAAIVAAGVLFTTETSWPGYAAAVPVLGTAAVIAAGFSITTGGPTSLIGTRPFRWLGGLSYSLYLWHWPLIVAATAHLGGLSPQFGLAIACFSIIPAWLTYRIVENPLRYSPAISRSPRLALSLGSNFVLIGAIAGLALLLLIPTTTANPNPTSTAPGAAILADNPRDDPAGAPVDTVAWMTPTPADATSDIPTAHADGCQQIYENTEVVTCEYGDPDGTIDIAVVGDSKMTQWMPALEPLAEQNGWQLTTYLKSSCSFAPVMLEYEGRPFEECRTWVDDVLQHLLADPPDYVITSQGQRRGRDESGQLSEAAMVDGLRTIWSQLTSQGPRVIVIADNPSPGLNVYECVQENLDSLSTCTYSRENYGTSSAAPVQHSAAKGMQGVKVVDLFDAICPTEQCAPVIGNVLIYRQGSHITATYAETLTPRLATALSEVGFQAEWG